MLIDGSVRTEKPVIKFSRTKLAIMPKPRAINEEGIPNNVFGNASMKAIVIKDNIIEFISDELI